MFWNTTSGPTDTLVGFADTDVANQQRSSYDNLERPTVDALWSRNTLKWQTATGYDGDRTTLTPPAGGTATTAITNAEGKTVELRQHLTGTPSGAYQASTYSYDRLSRLTGLADPAGNAWTTSYDLRGRVTRTVDPDKGATTMTYDDAGQLLTTTDARTITLSRTYDALGRQTALWQGNVDTGTKLTDATYDTLAKGQPTSSTRYVSGNAYTTAVTGYDTRYRPLGSAVTIPPVEGSLAGTWTTTASYKVDGSPATVTYPAAAGLAAETVSYTYDNTGAALTAVGQDTYIAATTYHPWGDANQRILGSGTKRVRVTTTIDEATRRLTTNQTHTENQTTPGTWVERLTETYDYDPAGNIKSINETSAGTTISNQCLSYDPLRQLLEAWTTTATACQSAPSQAVVGGPDPYWASYRYDTVGNRTLQVSHAATGDTTRSYSYPAPGAPQPHTLQSVTASGAATGTNSYTYDPTGNTTGRDIAGQPGQTLTWDPEGHLATLTTSAGVTSYLYDAAGNRLIGNDANGATLYLGHTEIRRDPLGSATATRYCPGSAVRTTTGGLVYQTSDHHGTTQLSINASDLSVTRRKSDPFGNPRGSQPTWPTTRGFVNGTTDPTGLTHLGAREYDPTTGRFISLDPVFDPADPQSWQGYTYANNTPVTASDPTGLRIAGCEEDRLNCRTGEELPSTAPVTRTPGCNGSAKDCVTKGPSGGGSPGSDQPLTEDEAAQILYGRPFKLIKNGPDMFLLNALLRCLNDGNAVACAWLMGQPPTNRLDYIVDELFGIHDLGDCYHHSVTGCAMLAISFIPIGKLAKVLRLFRWGKRAAGVARITKSVSGEGLSDSVLDEAFEYANSSQKLEHVIDPAKHGFGNLVQAAGGRSEAMRAIVDSLRCCGLPASGPFEVQRVIYGETVTIRGAMVNGVPRIGTAFIP